MEPTSTKKASGYKEKIGESTFRGAKQDLDKIEAQFVTQQGSREVKEQKEGMQLLSPSEREILTQWAEGRGQTPKKGEPGNLIFDVNLSDRKAREQKLGNLQTEQKKYSAQLQKDLVALEAALTTDIENATGMQKSTLTDKKAWVKKLRSGDSKIKLTTEFFDTAASASGIDVFSGPPPTHGVSMKKVAQTMKALENARNQLADFERGIALSKKARQILDKVEEIESPVPERLKKAVDAYKESVKELIEANDAHSKAIRPETGRMPSAAKVKQTKTELDNASKRAKVMQVKLVQLLNDVTTNINPNEINSKIRENDEKIEKYQKKLTTEKAGDLADLEKNLESCQGLSQALSRTLLRYSDEINYTKSKDEETKNKVAKAKEDFKELENSLRRWGALTNMESIRSLKQELQARTKETVGFDPKDLEADAKILFAIRETITELEKIDKAFGSIAGLENYKRDNINSMESWYLIGIIFTLTIILIPLVLITGLAYWAYSSNVESQEVKDTLTELKKWFSIKDHIGKIKVLDIDTEIHIKDPDTETLSKKDDKEEDWHSGI